jgi:hypothetical protein
MAVRSKELLFLDWASLSEVALLATSWHLDKVILVWRWAVFVGEHARYMRLTQNNPLVQF